MDQAESFVERLDGGTLEAGKSVEDAITPNWSYSEESLY